MAQNFILQPTGYSTQTLRPGETMLTLDGNTADLVTRYKYRDVYFNGTANSKLGQHKQGANRQLFNLYDEQERIPNNDTVYPESTFAGNKIFGYKVLDGGVLIEN